MMAGSFYECSMSLKLRGFLLRRNDGWEFFIFISCVKSGGIVTTMKIVISIIIKSPISSQTSVFRQSEKSKKQRLFGCEAVYPELVEGTEKSPDLQKVTANV